MAGSHYFNIGKVPKFFHQAIISIWEIAGIDSEVGRVSAGLADEEIFA